MFLSTVSIESKLFGVPAPPSWGSNAVNGVINIITLDAKDTQGGHVAGGAGNDTTGPETIRYGGKARAIGAYRVFAEGFHLERAAHICRIRRP